MKHLKAVLLLSTLCLLISTVQGFGYSQTEDYADIVYGENAHFKAYVVNGPDVTVADTEIPTGWDIKTEWSGEHRYISQGDNYEKARPLNIEIIPSDMSDEGEYTVEIVLENTGDTASSGMKVKQKQNLEYTVDLSSHRNEDNSDQDEEMPEEPESGGDGGGLPGLDDITDGLSDLAEKGQDLIGGSDEDSEKENDSEEPDSESSNQEQGTETDQNGGKDGSSSGITGSAFSVPSASPFLLLNLLVWGAVAVYLVKRRY